MCLFVLRLNIAVKNVRHVGTEQPLPGYYQYFRGIKCLVQGHNTTEVDFEIQISRSDVRCSTTVPPLTPKLNRDLLVPIDLGGSSPPSFPASHMCFDCRDTHSWSIFFRWFLFFRTQCIKRPWRRMKKLTSKATSRRTKNAVLKNKRYHKSKPFLKSQKHFVEKVARRPMIFFRFFFQLFSNEHCAKT